MMAGSSDHPRQDLKHRFDRLSATGATLAANALRPYTRFVRLMRILFPLSALGIVVLLMAWPEMEARIEPARELSKDTPEAGQNELLSPRYESRDKDGQPFTVTAVRALQSPEDSDLILLERPLADMTLKNGTWVAAEALNGAYRQKAQTLHLEDKITLFHDDGYEMSLTSLDVDLKANTAHSANPVKGRGPAGTLEATGMDAEMDAGLLIFRGPVRLVLNRSVTEGKTMIPDSKKRRRQ